MSTNGLSPLMVNVDYQSDYVAMISTRIDGDLFCGILLKMDERRETLESKAYSPLDVWNSLVTTASRDDVPCDPSKISSVVLRSCKFPFKSEQNGHLANGIDHDLRPRRPKKCAMSTIISLGSTVRSQSSVMDKDGESSSDVSNTSGKDKGQRTLKISFGKRQKKTTTVINMPNDDEHMMIEQCESEKAICDDQVCTDATEQGTSSELCHSRRKRRNEDASNSWNVGDIVWAKMRGYSHWPAEVRLPGHKKVCIVWCGTSNKTGIVPTGAVEAFQENFQRHYKSKHTKAYQNAVAVAIVKQMFSLKALQNSALLSEECRQTVVSLLTSFCPRCGVDTS